MTSIALRRFKASYTLLKEKLPDHADRMPSPLMAYSIFKQTFADNPAFAQSCARSTVCKDDIRAVASGLSSTSVVFSIIDECSAENFEQLVENLAHLAQDLGHK